MEDEWQLDDDGDNTGPYTLDINKIAIVLIEFFDRGSESLVNVIYKIICGLPRINRQSDQNLVLEKIRQILVSEKR